MINHLGQKWYLNINYVLTAFPEKKTQNYYYSSVCYLAVKDAILNCYIPNWAKNVTLNCVYKIGHEFKLYKYQMGKIIRTCSGTLEAGLKKSYMWGDYDTCSISGEGGPSDHTCGGSYIHVGEPYNTCSI